MNLIKNTIRFSTLAIGLILCTRAVPALAGANHIVMGTSSLTFNPSTLSINAGDSVTWNNLEAGGHTTTSATSLWSSSTDGFTFTFPNAGTFNYFCIPHQSFGMVGSVTVNAVANVPPTVTITSPANNTIFIAPASVTVQATAGDSDGTVASVQFRLGTAILTNITAAPFAVTSNNVPAGSNTLIAIATDNLGAKTTNSVSIIVDTTPSVSVTSPANNAVLSAPANVTIQASAFDSDVGGSVTNVQFLVGPNIFANKAAAPFSAVTNNLAAGSYTLSAVATDNLGVKNTNTVALSIVTPLPLTLSGQHVSGSTNFQFSYAANIGLTYVIQRSTNLAAAWTALITNMAASNPVVFVDNHATNAPGFYRVGRMPNP